MKSAIFAAIVALAVPILGQTLPQCAIDCSNTALEGSGCTALTDRKCICTSEKFIKEASSCIYKGCSASEIPVALQAARQMCLSVSVTLPATFATSEPSSASATPTSSEVKPTTDTATTETSTGSATDTSSAMETGTTTESGTAEGTTTEISTALTSTIASAKNTTVTTVMTHTTGSTHPPGMTHTTKATSTGAAATMGASFGAILLAAAGVLAV